MSVSRLLAAVVLVLGGGCIERGTFTCDDDWQCANDGVCEPVVNGCSYPDPSCESGRRFSPFAPVGPICTEDAEEEPGSMFWERTYDGPPHGNDVAFDLALSPDRTLVALVGDTDVTPSDANILVQVYEVSTGDLVWSIDHGGDAGGPDTGRGVVFDADGNVVVVGAERTLAVADNIWIASYGAQGELLWSSSIDGEGGDDQAQDVALASNGELVVVGSSEVGDVDARQRDVWIGRFDREGAPVGVPVTMEPGAAGESDVAYGTWAQDGKVWVTGSITTDDGSGSHSIWTAAFSDGGELLWSDPYTAMDATPTDRGRNVRLGPAGTVIAVGTAQRDMWGREYDGAGETIRTLEIEVASHDEATSVFFTNDGGFVLSGLTGFVTDEEMTGGIWLRRYDAAAEEVWTVVRDEPGIEKAFAIVDVGDGTLVATGYVTVPGSGFDVWLRRLPM